MAASKKTQKVDFRTFTEGVAKLIGIDKSADMYTKTERILAWVKCQLEEKEEKDEEETEREEDPNNSATDGCIRCAFRLKHQDVVGPDGLAFHHTDVSGECATEPHCSGDRWTISEMKDHGTFCPKCIRWQSQCDWMPLMYEEWEPAMKTFAVEGTSQATEKDFWNRDYEAHLREEWKCECTICDVDDRYYCDTCNPSPPSRELWNGEWSKPDHPANPLCVHCECSCVN